MRVFESLPERAVIRAPLTPGVVGELRGSKCFGCLSQSCAANRHTHANAVCVVDVCRSIRRWDQSKCEPRTPVDRVLREAMQDADDALAMPRGCDEPGSVVQGRDAAALP